MEDWKQRDSRAVTVFHEVNIGSSGARNSGLVIASGDLVALCDADHIWAEDKLRINSKILVGSRNWVSYIRTL